MKDPDVRAAYLDIAARWRRMAAQSWATYERRQKWVTKSNPSFGRG